MKIQIETNNPCGEGDLMSESIARCEKCILPVTYPGINFNRQGVCSFCLEWTAEADSFENQRKNELDEIIQVYKGKGKYDAIVGLSGGKDSSYVAYYLYKNYNLKILGVHFDNGYNSEYAMNNLALIVDKLKIDLITIRPNQHFIKKLYTHFLKKQGEFCQVCNNMGYLLIASFYWNQKRLLGYSPLGVGGWSKKYDYQPRVSVTSMDYFFNNLTPELFEELMTQLFIEEDVVQAYMRLSDPRQAQINTKANNQLGDYAMKMIQLPDYVPWDLNEIPRILNRNLGWQQPPDRHDSHFDCTLFPIKEYLKFKKYKLTQETIKNSIMIREGRMTREEAIKRISLEQTEEPEIFQIFLSELGISKIDVNDEAEWSR
jgi:hypothetical protein